MLDEKNNQDNNNPQDLIENNENKKEETKKNSPSKNLSFLDDITHTVLKEDYPVYDRSFKIILIGESGN